MTDRESPEEERERTEGQQEIPEGELESPWEKVDRLADELKRFKEDHATLEQLKNDFPGVVEILTNFGHKHVLGGVIENAYRVNKNSRKYGNEELGALLQRALEAESQELPDAPPVETQYLRNPPLFMDHILYHFMREDMSKLATLLNYELAGNPKDLRGSYIRSIVRGYLLRDCQDSLAWFVNLKTPLTYRDSGSAQLSRNMIFEILKTKQHVDTRRIHLFYANYLEEPYVQKGGKEEVIALLTMLLVEYLHGIDSRVLFIKDNSLFDEAIFRIPSDDEVIPMEDKGKDDKHLILLDGALYYSAGGAIAVDKETDLGKAFDDELLEGYERNEETDKVKKQFCVDLKKALDGDRESRDMLYLNGSTHVLCSDFTVPKVDWEEMVEDPRAARARMLRSYEKDKVYDFDSPLIYMLFKNYYLTLWNEPQYQKFLYAAFEKHYKENGVSDPGRKEADCGCEEGSCAFKEMHKVYVSFFGNINVYDLVTMWRKALKTSTFPFDMDFFEKQYCGGRNVPFGIEAEEVVGMIRTILEKAPMVSGDRDPRKDEKVWNYLERMLSSFQFRKTRRFTNECGCGKVKP